MRGCLKKERALMSPEITLPKLLSSWFYHRGSANEFFITVESRSEEHKLRYLG